MLTRTTWYAKTRDHDKYTPLSLVVPLNQKGDTQKPNIQDRDTIQNQS